MKKFCILFLLIFSMIALAGCGKDSIGETQPLSSDKINYITIEDGPMDLSGLGESLNKSKDVYVSISGNSSDDILDSFATIGEVQSENITFELALTGNADWSKLSNLSSVGGLNTLIVYGDNTWTDLSPLNALADLSTLQLKTQKIENYEPLLKHGSLKKMILTEMPTYDFLTLLVMPLEEVEVTVEDDSWVAIDLLKFNPSLQKINAIDIDQFSVAETFGEDEDEKYYYYQQFADMISLTEAVKPAFNGSMALSETPPTLRREQVMLASSSQALQTVPYREQRMTNTACGFKEDAVGMNIFYPYIRMYDATSSTARTLKYATTPGMDQRFLGAVTKEAAKILVYFYVVDPANNYQLVEDFTSVNCEGYVRIVDLEKQVTYPASMIIATSAGESTDLSYYQQVYLSAIDNYLTGLTVEGE